MEDKTESIKKALNQFPQIRAVIGEERIIDLAQKESTNMLIAYIEKTYIDEKTNAHIIGLLDALKKEPNHIGALFLLEYYLRPYFTLKHLDKCLGSIAQEDRLGVSLSHLLDSKSFWQGYSEIEVAAYLKKKFGQITLEPCLKNGKSVDMKYYYNKEDYFVEVTAPKSHHKFIAKMEESAQTGQVVTVEDSTSRASEKVLTEVEHFKDILDETKSVIILNVNGSDFDEAEVEDCLLGVSSLAILKNAQTGQFIGTKVTRNPWTAFEADEDLKKIGIVMTYKRDFAVPSGAVAFTKKIFVIALKEEDAKPLEDILV